MTKLNLTNMSQFQEVLEAIQTAIQPLGMEISDIVYQQSIISNRPCLGESKPKPKNMIFLEIRINPVHRRERNTIDVKTS